MYVLLFKGGNKLDPFMQRAVQLAVDNVREGGGPFGAVLVRNGEMIAEGVNELHKRFDVSGHAELTAIRKAQEKLKTDDLSDCTMYASGEPCPMCLTSMYDVGIKEIYFGTSIEEAAAVGLGTSKVIYHELTKPNEKRTLQMKQMPLDKEQENPMTLWEQRDKNG